MSRNTGNQADAGIFSRGLMGLIHSWSRSGIVWTVVVFSLAIVTFGPALHDGFVFDDVAQVQHLAPADGAGGWARAAFEPWWPKEKRKTLWRPVTRLAILGQKSFAFALTGDNSPMVHHGASLLLHGAASVALLFLARALTFPWPAAGAAAMLLAVHPLRSEAVHQIIGQAEILAFLFMALGMSAYVALRRRGAGWPALAAGTGIFYALALGSKEHSLLFPVYLGLIEVLVFGRERRAGAVENAPAHARKPNYKALHGSLIALFIVYLLARRIVTGGFIEPSGNVPAFENPLARMTFLERFPAVMGIFGYFNAKAFLPAGLSPDYSAESLPFNEGWSWTLSVQGFMIALLLSAYMLHNFRRGGRTWALVASGLLFYVLTSNLFFTIGVAVAPRLWYAPLAGLGLFTGWWWDHWRRWSRNMMVMQGRRMTRIPDLLMAAGILLLVSASWNFAPAWGSERAFAEKTLEVFPRSWRAHHNLAREFYLAKEFAKGLPHARVATSIRPDAAQSWDYRGLNAMFLPGRAGEADYSFRRALELDPSLDLAKEHLDNLPGVTAAVEAAQREAAGASSPSTRPAQ